MDALKWELLILEEGGQTKAMKTSRILLSLTILLIIAATLIYPSEIFAESDSVDNDTPTEIEPAGRVVAIEVGGEYATNVRNVLKQLTFTEGDIIDDHDIELSKTRLAQLGLFWDSSMRYVSISDLDTPPEISDDLPDAPDGIDDLIVYVYVYQKTGFYLNPNESGGTVGDRDFFGSGKTLEFSYLSSGEDFDYWHLRFVNPQFMGSHNTASFMKSAMKNMLGVRDELTYDFKERYNLDKESTSFNMSTLYKENYQVNFGIEWQENDTEYHEGEVVEGEVIPAEGFDDEDIVIDSNMFLLSDEDFAPGDELIFNFSVGETKVDGEPWTRGGYNWSIGTQQSLESLGSDHSFGRYSLNGTRYIPVKSIIDTVVLHGAYNTTSGSLPHYQKPRLGSKLRGENGLDYYGNSTIVLTGEIRKSFCDDRLLGVAFIDMGKGYDSRSISLSNLDICAGVGMRIDLSRYWNWDIILSIDYAEGPFGDRWLFGLGQDNFASSGGEGQSGAGSSCGPGG